MDGIRYRLLLLLLSESAWLAASEATAYIETSSRYLIVHDPCYSFIWGGTLISENVLCALSFSLQVKTRVIPVLKAHNLLYIVHKKQAMCIYIVDV
jgi:hypothetical protein